MPSGEAIPSLPTDLTPLSGGRETPPPAANICRLHRAYPWLLMLSTAIAALFCLMYITKPVILSTSAPAVPAARSVPAAPKAVKTTKLTPAATTTQASLLPGNDRLPGELSPPSQGVKPATPAPRPTVPSPPSVATFEETNLRIQHILTAEAPGGYRARIDLDVPVLYQSRNLRWTPEDVAQARELVIRFTEYQEKSKQLRAEGHSLLAVWNRLIERSLPAKDLRADSPSLPSNQQDTVGTPRPADSITPGSIQIQPAGK